MERFITSNPTLAPDGSNNPPIHEFDYSGWDDFSAPDDLLCGLDSLNRSDSHRATTTPSASDIIDFGLYYADDLNQRGAGQIEKQNKEHGQDREEHQDEVQKAYLGDTTVSGQAPVKTRSRAAKEGPKAANYVKLRNMNILEHSISSTEAGLERLSAYARPPSHLDI